MSILISKNEVFLFYFFLPFLKKRKKIWSSSGVARGFVLENLQENLRNLKLGIWTVKYSKTRIYDEFQTKLMVVNVKKLKWNDLKVPNPTQNDHFGVKNDGFWPFVK